MALSVHHFNSSDEEIVGWTPLRTPDPAPTKEEDCIPNDQPEWSSLHDTVVDGGWVVAASKIKAGPPVDKSTNPSSGNDYKKAVEMATYAIKATRYLMKEGAYNARFPMHSSSNPVDDVANYADPSHPPRYVSDFSPKYQYDRAEDLFNELASEHIFAGSLVRSQIGSVPLDPLSQIMARSHATLLCRGGVCSMMSAATVAMISLQSYPIAYKGSHDYTEVCVCSHSADHSFCIVSYGGSPWIVADPWVGEPYAIPLADNYFDRAGIQQYQRILFARRCKTPWGIELMKAYYDETVLDKENPEQITNFLLTPAKVKAAETKIGVRQIISDDYKIEQDGMTYSGEERNAHEKKIHTDHVWCHQTNHGSFKETYEDEPHSECLQRFKEDVRETQSPILRANQWGQNAGIF